MRWWVLVWIIAVSNAISISTQWTEHVYGKVDGDDLEYASFHVPRGVYQVQVTFSRSDLRGRTAPPRLYGKLGSLPSETNYDWNFNGTLETFWFSEVIPDLKIGTYYVTLYGGDKLASISNFGIGNSTYVWYYLDVTFLACVDPNKIGYNCDLYLVPTVHTPVLETPQTSIAVTTSKQCTPTKICLDYVSNLQFYEIDLSIPSVALTIMLSFPNYSRRNHYYYWAIYKGQQNPFEAHAFPLMDNSGFLSEKTSAFQVDFPNTGSYRVLVYVDSLSSFSDCFTGKGINMTLSWVADSCGANTDANPDHCNSFWMHLDDIRSDPSRNHSVAHTWLVPSTSVITSAGVESFSMAYTAHVANEYAGSNIFVILSTSSEIEWDNIRIYIRVNGFPTESTYDYTFNGVDARELSATEAAILDGPNGISLAQRFESNSDTIFRKSWARIRFPKVGEWTIAVKGVQSERWESVLALHSDPCPGDMCGAHGKCIVSTTYQGLIVGKCQCIYGYAGEFCDALYLDNYESQSLFLILSNLAILPAAVISFYRGFYVESILFFSLGIISSLYHACEINWVCVIQYSYLQKLDFIFSFNSILLCLFHLSGIRATRKAIMQFVGLALLIILISINPTTMMNWMIIGLIGGGQLVIAWTTYFVLAKVMMGRRTRIYKIMYSFFFISGNFYPTILVGGVMMWNAALVCWFLNKGPSYWLEHSLWHIFAMSAAGCLMGCRKNQWYKILDSNGMDVLPRVHSPISKRPFFGTNIEMKSSYPNTIITPTPFVIPIAVSPSQHHELSIEVGESERNTP